MRLKWLVFSFICLLSLTSRGGALQESMMTPESIMQGDYADSERQTLMAFLPRAQQILIMRNQLIPILQAYAFSAPEDEYSNKMIELVDRMFPADYKPGQGGYLHVLFEYSAEGFKVDGIEADRLAINTGNDIRFNVRGLQKKEKLSLADITQLWLHELSHFDKNTSLEIRDQWVAKVTQWVQERSTEIQLSENQKVYSLIMPATPLGPEAISRPAGTWDYQVQPDTLHRNNIKRSFILLYQTSKQTRFYEPAYDGFQNFDNIINKGTPDWNQQMSYDSTTINWPTIQVKSVKLLPNKKLQFEYAQTSTLYERERSRKDTFYRKNGMSMHGALPVFPETIYRVELDTRSDELDIKRNYAKPMDDGDFELYQVRDKGNSRYVSLRLKVPDVQMKLERLASLHLIAKDLVTSELLSFEVKKIHFTNKDEAYLHVKIPNRNLELTQLLLPLVSRYGAYKEFKLLPSRPFSLFGPGGKPYKKLKLKAMEIQEKQFEEDRVRAEIPVTSSKKVIAVTLDIEHKLMGLDASSPQFGGSKDLLGTGDGRKYYVKGNDLENKNGRLVITIPEADINQVQSGGTYRQRIGSHSYDQQTELVTIRDTGERRIRGVWMHFADGTVEKVPTKKLPRRSFSIEFNPHNVKIRQCSDLFHGMSKSEAAWLEYQSHFMNTWDLE